jgi:ATP-dependent Clp protease adaptor protein ClpS
MEPGYHVIVWNDPVNLMSYVTHVFQKLFGWPREKAEHHMMEVHTLGKSVVAQETRERAEHYVHQLHAYRLQASCEPANQ